VAEQGGLSLPIFRTQIVQARKSLRDAQIKVFIDDLLERADFGHACETQDLGRARTMFMATVYRHWPDSAEIPSWVLGKIGTLEATVKW
jgi:hypothetical protein